jgi:hypothetical protein
MATVDNRKLSRTESKETDFYLPAASISATLDRIGSIVGRTVGRHGRVLIPDTYNK